MWMLSGSIFSTKAANCGFCGETLERIIIQSRLAQLPGSGMLDPLESLEVNRLTKMIFFCYLGPGNYN
jgi:hypothetical protein